MTNPNLDGSAWRDLCLSSQYIEWCGKCNMRYIMELRRHVADNKRVPIGVLKDGLALAQEHGWERSVKEYKDILKLST